ncbi:MAG: hypothetical protein Q9227_008673 [Pyrenula ochraceoflavens]
MGRHGIEQQAHRSHSKTSFAFLRLRPSPSLRPVSWHSKLSRTSSRGSSSSILTFGAFDGPSDERKYSTISQAYSVSQEDGLNTRLKHEGVQIEKPDTAEPAHSFRGLERSEQGLPRKARDTVEAARFQSDPCTKTRHLWKGRKSTTQSRRPSIELVRSVLPSPQRPTLLSFDGTLAAAPNTGQERNPRPKSKMPTPRETVRSAQASSQTETVHCRNSGMQTVSKDDYLLVRGANPRTGVVTPSVHSDHTASSRGDVSYLTAHKVNPSAKWRRLGDQWISLDIGQPTPDVSPCHSIQDEPEPRAPPSLIPRRNRFGLRTPPKLSPKNRASSRETQKGHLEVLPKTQANLPCLSSKTQPGKHMVTSSWRRSCGDSTISQRTTPRFKERSVSEPAHTVMCNQWTSSNMNSIPRKAVGTPPSTPRKTSIAVSMKGPQAMPTCNLDAKNPISNIANRQRFLSQPPRREEYRFFSPDDVGKELPKLPAEEDAASTKQGLDNIGQDLFLGQDKKVCYEDMPVRFQTPPPGKRDKPLPNLPMNDGPSHLPLSMRPLLKNIPSPPAESRGRMEIGTGYGGYHLSQSWQHHIKTQKGVSQRYRQCVGPLRQLPDHVTWNHSQSWKMRPCPHTCQERPQRRVPSRRDWLPTRREQLPQLQSKSWSGESTSASTSPAMSAVTHTSTDTSISTTSSSPQDPAIDVGSDHLPKKPISTPRQRSGVPVLRRKDGSTEVPRVNKQGASDDQGNLIQAKPSIETLPPTKSNGTAFEDREHPRRVLCPGVDCHVGYADGSMIANPCQITNGKHLEGRMACHPHSISDKRQVSMPGCIPASENHAVSLTAHGQGDASATPCHDSCESKQDRGETTNDTNTDTSLSFNKSYTHSHDRCCAICCVDGAHECCLGHPSPSISVANSSMPTTPKPIQGTEKQADNIARAKALTNPISNRLDAIMYPLADTLNVQHSTNSDTHSDYWGSTHRAGTELSEGGTPFETRTFVSTIPTSSSEFTPRRAFSSASLKTVHFPAIPRLSSACDVFFLTPLQFAGHWLSKHPKVMSVVYLAAFVLVSMAIHIVSVGMEAYEVIKEYRRCGRVRVRGGGWRVFGESVRIGVEATILLGVALVGKAVGNVILRALWAVSWCLGLR